MRARGWGLKKANKSVKEAGVISKRVPSSLPGGFFQTEIFPLASKSEPVARPSVFEVAILAEVVDLLTGEPDSQVEFLEQLGNLTGCERQLFSLSGQHGPSQGLQNGMKGSPYPLDLQLCRWKLGETMPVGDIVGSKKLKNGPNVAGLFEVLN